MKSKDILHILTFLYVIISQKDGETIKQDALMQTATFYIPQENDGKIIEHELIKVMYPLIQQIASKF